MKRLSDNALRKAKAFDIKELGKQLIGVYEQSIQDKKDNRYVTLQAEETTEQQTISPTQV